MSNIENRLVMITNLTWLAGVHIGSKHTLYVEKHKEFQVWPGVWKRQKVDFLNGCSDGWSETILYRRENSIWYLICDIRSYDHSVIIDQNLDGWDDSKNKERKPNLMWPPHAASSQCGYSPSPSRSLPLTDGRKPPLSPSYCSLKIQGRKYGKGREKDENGFRRTRRSRRGAYIASSPPLAHCSPRGNPS